MHRRKLYWGTLSTLSLTICAITSASLANDETTSTNKTIEMTQHQETGSPQQLKTLVFAAEQTPAKDPDISAVAKTIVTREEMLQFGDQSVNDALRRAAGFQMLTFGQGPRGSSGSGSMRFRGGGAPVFLINGEAVKGGPRGGISIVDSITPEMIEQIEITKQPSVAQASVASSAVINIILKEPLDNARISGNVKFRIWHHPIRSKRRTT